MHRRKIRAGVAALCASLLLAGCGGGGDDDEEAPPEEPQDKCTPVFHAGEDGGKGAWLFPCGRDYAPGG